MITTTTAPPWLHRSDQALTWARTMLTPHRAVIIDIETQQIAGGNWRSRGGQRKVAQSS